MVVKKAKGCKVIIRQPYCTIAHTLSTVAASLHPNWTYFYLASDAASYICCFRSGP
jgi:hypothetical protein